MSKFENEMKASTHASYDLDGMRKKKTVNFYIDETWRSYTLVLLASAFFNQNSATFVISKKKGIGSILMHNF